MSKKLAIMAAVALSLWVGISVLIRIRADARWVISGRAEGKDLLLDIHTVPASDAAYGIMVSGTGSRCLRPFRTEVTPTSGTLVEGVAVTFCDPTLRPGRFVLSVMGMNVDVTPYRVIVADTEYAPGSTIHIPVSAPKRRDGLIEQPSDQREDTKP